ncbi:MAG: potassium transporter TrkG [Planctomycetota bacterium]
MIQENVISTIRYLAALVGCVVLWPWLGNSPGGSDSVIVGVPAVALTVLILFDLFIHLHSRSFYRAIPGMVAIANILLSFLWALDTYIVIAALITIFTCILDAFTAVLDRVRKGAPFLVFLLFLVPILLGAFVLSFPRCHSVGTALTATESLFTAISAVTVTGLSVIDVGARLSQEGQWFLLSLIQLGGLGMVSLFAFFALVLGNGLGLSQGRAIRESLAGLSSSELRQLLGTICISTITIEVLGAALLYFGSGSSLSVQSALFHSVSAFCNAGFTLNPDSLESWDLSSKAIMAILIVVGGIGFPVIHEFQRRFLRKDSVRFSLQTKLILTVSAVLLVGGSGLLLLTGAGAESWFWSITARTAGFSTDATSGLPMAATLVLMVLMVIGASPGSTGGGVKTTTLAVLFLALRSEISGSRSVVAWKRSIPDTVVRSAAVLTILAAILWFLLVVVLLLVEATALQSGRFTFLDLVFEVTSALGTVGLSRDVTGHLSDAGTWVIECAMILGRLGPLAVIITLASLSPSPLRGERPVGKVMLG